MPCLSRSLPRMQRQRRCPCPPQRTITLTLTTSKETLAAPKWAAKRQATQRGNGELLSVCVGDDSLSVADVLTGWRQDFAFREFFIAELAATPYAAFFWELPRV